MTDRYYLSELAGWGNTGFNGGHSGSNRGAGVSFSILDRYTCHREVLTSYRHDLHVRSQDRTVVARRHMMRREVERLNALDKL